MAKRHATKLMNEIMKDIDSVRMLFIFLFFFQKKEEEENSVIYAAGSLDRLIKYNLTSQLPIIWRTS